MAEKALAAVIQEAYIPGQNVRPARSFRPGAGSSGMSGVSKSQVSRLCGEIDDKAQRLPRNDRWRATGPICGNVVLHRT